MNPLHLLQRDIKAQTMIQTTVRNGMNSAEKILMKQDQMERVIERISQMVVKSTWKGGEKSLKQIQKSIIQNKMWTKEM